MFTCAAVTDQETVERVLQVVWDTRVKMVVRVFAGSIFGDPGEVLGDAPDVCIDGELGSTEA